MIVWKLYPVATSNMHFLLEHMGVNFWNWIQKDMNSIICTEISMKYCGNTLSHNFMTMYFQSIYLNVLLEIHSLQNSRGGSCYFCKSWKMNVIQFFCHTKWCPSCCIPQDLTPSLCPCSMSIVLFMSWIQPVKHHTSKYVVLVGHITFIKKITAYFWWWTENYTLLSSIHCIVHHPLKHFHEKKALNVQNESLLNFTQLKINS